MELYGNGTLRQRMMNHGWDEEYFGIWALFGKMGCSTSDGRLRAHGVQVWFLATTKSVLVFLCCIENEQR